MTIELVGKVACMTDFWAGRLRDQLTVALGDTNNVVPGRQQGVDLALEMLWEWERARPRPKDNIDAAVAMIRAQIVAEVSDNLEALKAGLV